MSTTSSTMYIDLFLPLTLLSGVYGSLGARQIFYAVLLLYLTTIKRV